MCIAPPKEERTIPIASGVDRGASSGYQLVTPAAVLVVKNNIIVADKSGHKLLRYRSSDLAPIGSCLPTADTPVTLTLFKDYIYVCYTNVFVQYTSKSNENRDISSLDYISSIRIPNACCTASNDNNLYVGTIEPSIIQVNSHTLETYRLFHIHPIRYYNNNRFPWLQDMKATEDCLFCLFTGSPSPLQAFSLEGDLISSILTEHQIVGAYHFALYRNPATEEWSIYITDFWDNALKVFDMEGQLIETFSEKGFGLGQIFHPTGIFVEESGIITICDMKEENCLQRI